MYTPILMKNAATLTYLKQLMTDLD